MDSLPFVCRKLKISLKTPVFHTVILILLLSPVFHAEFLVPTPSIPGYWRRTIEGSVTGLDLAYNGAYLAVASDSGLIYMFDREGNILWKEPLRAGVAYLKGSLNLEYLVAVSQAKELAVYSYNGSLIDYWYGCSRADVRTLIYDYLRSTVVLLDEVGWLYAYSLTDPVGRGEKWILDYSYTSPLYNVTVSGFDSQSFEEAYMLETPGGPGGEVAIPVYTKISDNRTGIYESYEAPTLLFYRVSGKNVEEYFQVILEDLAGYKVDSAYYYGGGDTRILTVAASSESAVLPVNRFLVCLYDLSQAAVGNLTVLHASWTYSLGGRALGLKMDSTGRYLAVSSEDYGLYMFARKGLTCEYLWTVSLASKPSAVTLASSPISAVSGTEDGWIYFLDGSGELLWKAPLSGSEASSLDLSELSYLLAAGFSDGSICLISDARVKRRLLEISLADEAGSIPGANITLAGTSLEIETVSPTLLLLPEGRYLVTVDHIALGRTSVEVPLSSDLSLVVDPDTLVQPLYPLSFKVYDSRSSSIEIERFRVEVEGKLGFQAEAELTTGNQTLILPRDTYTVKLYSDHYLPVEAEVRLTQSVTLNLSLTPETYDLTVLTLSQTGEPLTRAMVELWWMGTLYASAYTTPTGEALLTAPYGEYTVKIHAEHHEPLEQKLLLTDDTQIAATLKPVLYNATVKILGEDGTPIPEGRLKVYRNEQLYSEANFTGGIYEATLPYGAYKLEAESLGWKPKSIKLVVPEETSGRITLPLEVYPLTVTVVDDQGVPLEGARVTISGPKSLAAFTDLSGIFRTEAPRGSYTVTVDLEGYRPVVRSIELSKPTPVSITLQPEPLTIVKRYLPTIILLVAAPAASLIILILYLRRRRRLEFEEIPEEELEELGVGET